MPPILQTSQRSSSVLRDAQRKTAIRLVRLGTYADNFRPPEWWTALLRTELAPRGASSALLRAAKTAFGVDYDKGRLSRLSNDLEGASVEMLTHLSLILGLPIPIFVVSSESNAKRMLGEALLCDEVDPKMLKIAAGVRHLLVRGHTDSVKPEHGIRPDPGAGPKPKR